MDDPDETAALRAEVARLEAELAAERRRARVFWRAGNWQEALKLIGLPMAFVLSLYTFYDTVYLRWAGRDAVTLAAVRGNLSTLQNLNAQSYGLRASNAAGLAGAVDAAHLGQRQRLVSETFGYWQRHPDFFQPKEAQMLANQLLLEERTADAARVAEGLDASARTPRARAELALFRGRIYGAPGDAFDLERARAYLREAAALTETIPIRSDAHAVLEQIVYYRVYMELRYEQDCDYVAPMVQALREMTPQDGSGDRGAAQLVEIFEARCGA